MVIIILPIIIHWILSYFSRTIIILDLFETDNSRSKNLPYYILMLYHIVLPFEKGWTTLSFLLLKHCTVFDWPPVQQHIQRYKKEKIFKALTFVQYMTVDGWVWTHWSEARRLVRTCAREFDATYIRLLSKSERIFGSQIDRFRYSFLKIMHQKSLVSYDVRSYKIANFSWILEKRVSGLTDEIPMRF